ncbi:hypothetical protein HDU96_009276 [Phlyctochytrium bullatum]|nr:hypothetical protein HDU96_009276 [Phlyctochytrium bullatum]
MHFKTLPLLAAVAVATGVAAQEEACPPTSYFLDQSGKNAKVYDTQMGWEKGRRVYFWDFGAFSAPAGPASAPSSRVGVIPIYLIFYANGTKAGDNIIDTLPCQPGYSDLWSAQNITLTPAASATYTPNALRNASAVLAEVAAGRATQTSLGVNVNCPVVPFGSTVKDSSPANGAAVPKPVSGWFKGEKVFYFDFGPVEYGVETQMVFATATKDGKKAADSMWVVFLIKFLFAMRTRAEQKKLTSFPPFQNRSFDGLDTPFWGLTLVTDVPDSLVGGLKSRDDIVKAGLATRDGGKVVNCPIAFVDTRAAVSAAATGTAAPTTTSMVATTTTRSAAGKVAVGGVAVAAAVVVGLMGL